MFELNQKIVNDILKKEKEMEQLSIEDFPAKMEEFRQKANKKLDTVLPEVYALVREATNRALHMKHYPVQILGGIALHQGKIAELKTGEGKTMVALLPACLNALAKKGVQIVTVNDYLAKRDATWMAPVYELLGLRVGYVISTSNFEERKAAYACDITYVTNSELGFDYMRDHLVLDVEGKVQREFYYAIVDEADSVFIDEARTPLIIANQKRESFQMQKAADRFVKKLKRSQKKQELDAKDLLETKFPEVDGDYIVDEKRKTIVLTERGYEKAENYFGLEFGKMQNGIYLHHVELALQANYMMHRDMDYIVRGGRVLIVDEFTGRVMPDRRFSDGLHQAIEAKEGVEIQQDTQTIASITYQSLFRKYQKLSGMTGTIATERKEMKDIYGLKVSVIPTNAPVIREDLPNRVYAHKKEKYEAILEEILVAHQKGQPILVGTSFIQTSEELSHLLQKEGISHQILNAKNHEKEAEIVSHAGEYGMVTIATNMAGRGTDIKLSEDAVMAGGLYVIGAEMSEAKRIDQQLRGRSGRQGDPGKTQFFVSFEDQLIHPFLPQKIFAYAYEEETEEITSKSTRKIIAKAQKQRELENFGVRKNVFDYDQVNHLQMESYYQKRDFVLEEGKEMEALQKMDALWTKHLHALEELKRYVSLKSLGQIEPVTEYKLCAYRLFKEFLKEIEKGA